jgi:hypothetical protein
MKPLLLLLALSLAANAALFLRGSSTNAPPDKPADINAATSGAPRSSAASAADAQAALWRQIDAGDPSAIEQLRAAGWPPEAIASAVRAHLHLRLRAEIKSRWPDADQDNYWSSQAMFGGPTEQRKLQHELWKKYEATLTKLLGPQASFQDDNWRDLRFSDLPPEKANVVRAIEDDYRLLLSEARGSFDPDGNNLVLPEDIEKLRFLEKERRADLARALTPEELFEYELRSTDAANGIRFRLDAFDPSEEEFRAIFRIVQETSARRGRVEVYGSVPPDEQALQKQVQAEIEAQLQQQLSPERYADYKRAQDFDYRALHELGKHFDLPMSAVRAAHDVKLTSEQRIAQLRKNPPKDPDEMRVALTEIVDEAEVQVNAALGERAYEIYAQNYTFLANLRRSIPQAKSTNR